MKIVFTKTLLHHESAQWMKIPAVDPKFRVEWMLRTNNIVKYERYVIFSAINIHKF